MKFLYRFILLVPALLLCLTALQSQWILKDHSHPDESVTCLAVVQDSAGTTLFTGFLYGAVCASTDDGDTWMTLRQGLVNSDRTPFAITSLTDSGTTHLLISTVDSGVFHYTGSGTSWIRRGISRAGAYITRLAVCGMRIFAATPDSGLYVSTNKGMSWSPVSNNLPVAAVYSIGVSGPTILAGYQGGLYRSDDSGMTWRSFHSGLHPIASILGVAITNNYCYAATNGVGIYRVAAGDSVWTQSDSGIVNHYVGTLAVCNSSGQSNIIAGTMGSGIYLSTDNGVYWADISAGLTFLGIWSIGYSSSYLFLGTGDGGIWRRPISEVISSVTPGAGQSPREVWLGQNYPNPFNPSTNVRFEIRDSRFVRLSIYDVLGRDVATLVNGTLRAGAYDVVWHAEGVPGGVYFYTLQAGLYTATKKMLLIK